MELKKTKQIILERRVLLERVHQGSDVGWEKEIAKASIDMLNDISKAIEEDLIEEQRRPDLEKEHDSIEGHPC